MTSAKRSVWTRFERLLEAIVDHVPHVVFVKDADLRFVLVNRAGEELLGTPRSLVLGRSVHELVAPDQADSFAASDREALAAGGPIEIAEEPFLSPTQGLRLLRTMKIPILGTDGRPQYLLGVSEDMTARLELEAQLRHAQRLESLGRLTAGVAHDFRNLLTVITVCTTEALSELPPDHPVVDELRDIHAASERATALTRRMLALGGRHAPAPQVIDLTMVVFRLEPLLRRLLGERVELAIVEHVVAAHVHADTGQIEHDRDRSVRARGCA
jgi:two-component system, cell cycle sensor histidine kinase and response regulator CckA